jgi:hypothetical protein
LTVTVFKTFIRVFDRKKRRLLKKPKCLEEAVQSLLWSIDILPREAKKALMEIESPDQFATRFHHAGGRKIRNVWSLWNPDSELHRDFVDRFGIDHADDMSSMIYQCAWQVLHGEEPTPDKFAEGYRSYWEAVNAGEGEIKTLSGKVIRIVKENDGDGTAYEEITKATREHFDEIELDYDEMKRRHNGTKTC